MTQSFWEPEVVEQETQQESTEPVAAMVVSVDEFAALEERVLRAVQLVKQERQTRIAAEDRAAQAEAHAAEAETLAQLAEAELSNKTPVLDSLQSEIKTLRAERDHVRERVERLLQQLDALEL